ncbi:MAG: PAS domain S-box protein, partial [Ignavibacteriae bacterium]|nr:PAS domain S-box protein [Ignavibacteriota bacterium]
IPDESGIIVEVYCICRDITEEQLIETRLLQSEARYRLLVERMRDYAIYMLDTSGRITTWNENAERIKGYHAEEIIGEHFSRFHTQDDLRHGKPDKLLRQAKQTGRVEDEGWRVRKDGSQFWVDVVITGLWDDKGNLRGFGKLTRDLTAQRLAEHALNENQERLRAIFDHSPSMIFMKDAGGRYIDCNPPFEELCGKPRNEIIGKTDLELFDHRQATEFINNDRLVFEQGKPIKFEETAQHKDGPRVSIVTKFPLRDTSGNIFAIGGIVTDITKRKMSEESMRHMTGRLIQLQDEQEQRVAEQLERGPGRILTALTSQLNTLAQSGVELDQQCTEALQKSLALAREAQQALDAIDTTTYLRMLDEKGLLETLRAYQQDFSHETDMQVVLELPQKLKRLPAEAERALFRVVQESLANTHRHSGGAGATVQLHQLGNTIALSITDNGKGIPAGVLDTETGYVISSSVGIRGMVERMRQLDGSLEIHTGDWGTTVNAILALNTRDSQK